MMAKTIDWTTYCLYCQKQYKTRTRFEKHVREEHPNTYAANALERGDL